MTPFHPRFTHVWKTTLGTLGTIASLTTILVLAQPTVSAAQTVTAKDLVGSWAWQGEKEVKATFRADNTTTIWLGTPSGTGTLTGRWRLSADTLMLSDLIRTVGGEQKPATMGPRLVQLKDKLLTLTKVDTTEKGPKQRVLERVDSAAAGSSKP